jgi:hypothetical protein
MIAFTTMGWCNVRVLLNNLHSVIWYVCFLPIQIFKLIFLSFLHFIIAFFDYLHHLETIKANMALFSNFSNMKFYRPILCFFLNTNFHHRMNKTWFYWWIPSCKRNNFFHLIKLYLCLITLLANSVIFTMLNLHHLNKSLTNYFLNFDIVTEELPTHD